MRAGDQLKWFLSGYVVNTDFQNSSCMSKNVTAEVSDHVRFQKRALIGQKKSEFSERAPFVPEADTSVWRRNETTPKHVERENGRWVGRIFRSQHEPKETREKWKKWGANFCFSRSTYLKMHGPWSRNAVFVHVALTKPKLNFWPSSQARMAIVEKPRS